MLNKLRITLFCKMIIAFFVSYFLASALKLEFAFTSGVIAVLSLALTKEQVFKSALKRLSISLFGIGIATLMFYLLGFTPLALIIIVALLLIFAFFVKLEIGIVLALVLIGHIYGAKDFKISLNSIYLLLINVSIAFIFNLYMPRGTNNINAYKRQIETSIKQVFVDIYENKPSDFVSYRKLVKAAKSDTILIQENWSNEKTNKEFDYITMREKQFFILERISPILLSTQSSIYKQLLLDYINLYAKRIGEENYAIYLKEQLTNLLDQYKKLAIPKDRLEFEHRAELYHVLVELDDFLDLKLAYHQNYDK